MADTARAGTKMGSIDRPSERNEKPPGLLCRVPEAPLPRHMEQMGYRNGGPGPRGKCFHAKHSIRGSRVKSEGKMPPVTAEQGFLPLSWLAGRRPEGRIRS